MNKEEKKAYMKKYLVEYRKTHPRKTKEVMCPQCAKVFETRVYYNPKSCRDCNRPPINYGKDNGYWKGGSWISSKGYIYVRRPDHPKAHCSYVPEHRLIMEQFIGRLLETKEIVHHINGNSMDNRIENLMIVDLSTHRKLHKGKLWRCRNLKQVPTPSTEE